MMRQALALCLLVVLSGTALAQQSLQLEVDGQQFGAFATLAQDRAAEGTVTLEQGWISVALLGLWWPALGDGLAPGAHHFPAECEGRRVEVTQALGPGDARGRLRSWSLMDACPIDAEVEAQDGDRLSVTSLTLRVKGIAAAM